MPSHWPVTERHANGDSKWVPVTMDPSAPLWRPVSRTALVLRCGTGWSLTWPERVEVWPGRWLISPRWYRSACQASQSRSSCGVEEAGSRRRAQKARNSRSGSTAFPLTGATAGDCRPAPLNSLVCCPHPAPCRCDRTLRPRHRPIRPNSHRHRECRLRWHFQCRARGVDSEGPTDLPRYAIRFLTLASLITSRTFGSSTVQLRCARLLRFRPTFVRWRSRRPDRRNRGGIQ